VDELQKDTAQEMKANADQQPSLVDDVNLIAAEIPCLQIHDDDAYHEASVDHGVNSPGDEDGAPQPQGDQPDAGLHQRQQDDEAVNTFEKLFPNSIRVAGMKHIADNALGAALHSMRGTFSLHLCICDICRLMA
jgi:hypothetical protein